MPDKTAGGRFAVSVPCSAHKTSLTMADKSEIPPFIKKKCGGVRGRMLRLFAGLEERLLW